MLELDHIAIAGETLAKAVAHAETMLDVPMGPGGRHARFGTHNRLLGLAPALYLEAIAIDPDAPPPPDARWFGLDDFRGPARLDKWICRVPDLDAAVEAYPEAGRPVALSRGALRWRMAVPEDGGLPYDGLFPALIEWQVPDLPGRSLPSPGLTLTTLTVQHPDAQALAARLLPHLSDARIRFETGPAQLCAEITRGREALCLT